MTAVLSPGQMRSIPMPGIQEGAGSLHHRLALRVRWLAEPSEGLQAPFVSHALVPQDVQIAIIRPHLEEDGVRPIPLIDHFLDYIFMVSELKPNRPFVSLSPRIRLDSQNHSCSRSSVRTPPQRYHALPLEDATRGILLC
jgi:hypothetical protein